MSSNYENPATEFNTMSNIQSLPRERDYRIPLLILAAIIVIIDHVTKRMVVARLRPGQTHTVFDHIFRISHVLNTGAAFSFLSDSVSPLAVRYGLIAFSIIAVILVGSMLWRVGREISPTSVGLALILGGAIGNLYDRIHYHFVIDFLEVTIVHYHWPDFNVADSCIVIGACLLFIEIFRTQPENS
jgi:signal peptidase II